jgi:hypothetical protein
MRDVVRFVTWSLTIGIVLMVGLWLVVAAVAVDDVYDTPSTTTTTIVVVPETHAPTLAASSGDEWVSESTLARSQVVNDRLQAHADGVADGW